MFKTSRALHWPLLAGIGAILLTACGGGEPTAVETERSRPQSVASTAATAIPFYTLKRLDLGIIGGSVVNAKGLNAAGQVTGLIPVPPSGITQAFFYNGSTTIALGALGGQSASRGVALNGGGQVAGWSETPGTKGFSWTPPAGPMVGLSPASTSLAHAINDAGLIVGLELTGTGLGGFAWQGGSYTSYASTFTRFDAVNNGGTMAGSRVGSIAGIRRADGNVVSVWTAAPSFAKLLNDAELVAGQVGGVSSGRAFAWQGGTEYPIGDTLAATGYIGSLAIDLNQVGQLVGYATSGATFENAGYIWSPGVDPSFIGNFPGEPLNTLPRAINNHGQVVGAAGSPQRAFTWTAATGMVDLLTRVVGAPSGLFLLDAQAINDSGQIVVRANTGLFLLTPADPTTPVQPLLGTIQAADPVAVGTPLAMSVPFTDFNTSDTHSAVWNWGDGSSETGTVSEGNGAGSISGSHAYAAGGIYRVSVTVTDSGGQSATVSREVVVYDPNGGHVSGSGWFESPQGAFIADPTLAGRAEFGFVSKYRKGATLPSGQTTFQFQAASLRFRSDTYDWLVVAGARAQYKGVGRLNGVAGYKFMLTGVDGDLLGRGTSDRFRIKIWHFDANLNADVVDYDNQIDSSTEGGTSEGTALRGGSIVIAK